MNYTRSIGHSLYAAELYNEPELRDGLPQSPLEPRIAATGFRRDEET